jgi:aspartyl-tRNA(Asn)/glutamyl-tRNA(Gln) amidotransferase subunit C
MNDGERSAPEITLDVVRKIARLAHLEYPKIAGPGGKLGEPDSVLIDEQNLAKIAEDLGKILEHVRQLDEVDVRDVPPTSYGVPLPTRVRPDVVNTSFEPEKALQGAPQRIGQSFAVPKIIE